MPILTPERKQAYQKTENILAYVSGVLMVLPLAPFICKYIPPILIGEWNIDMFIALILAFAVIRLLISLVKPLIVPIFLLLVAFFTYNQFSGKYAFSNMIGDYKSIVEHNWTVREEKQTDLISLDPSVFSKPNNRTTRKVLTKMQYTDSVVRNFSVKNSLAYFDDYRNKYGMLTRHLSLFKYINTHFNYVPDAQRDEYFATPKETILNGLGGDCDDHSILMASTLMSIGAKCRLVVIEGHMYPELYVGDKEQYEIMQQAIIQLFRGVNVEKIYYHENNGEYWINLDYTARHPGGPYLNNNVKYIIDL